jgi:hypothetical protein
MKTLLGLAIAGTLLGAGTAGAFTVTDPATGAGDLILFIQDVTTNQTYARDTGISLASVYAVDSTGANTAPALNVNVTADANLTTFLGSLTKTDTLQWAVEGGNWTGSGSTALAPIGQERIVTTSGTGNATAVSQSSFTSKFVNFAVEVSNLNAFGLLDPTGSTHETGVKATSGDGIWGGPNGVSGDTVWYQALDNSGIPITASQSLYGLTGNGTKGGVAKNSLLGTLSLDSLGNLTSAGGSPPPVPLPAALWVFGSGLLGLFGVGRRRSTANA